MKSSQEIKEALEKEVVGQPQAIASVIPFVQLYQAGLNPEGRPVGVVLLMGPTGVGKTETVEALAHILHGNRKQMLRIDCGEYQADHEVAKLIGAPPGYLGHGLTPAVMNQKKIKSLSSDESDIQIILFDEVEKASPAMTRLLLGVFDKASLKLGDGSDVNFENSLIFMTSNLGAKAMQKATTADFGLEMFWSKQSKANLHTIGTNAVKKAFTPEFINRIDSIVTYSPLNRESCGSILLHIMESFHKLAKSRMGLKAFNILVTNQAESEILDQGTSQEYGARELKRVFQRHVILPLSSLVENGQVPPQSTIVVDYSDGFTLSIR